MDFLQDKRFPQKVDETRTSGLLKTQRDAQARVKGALEDDEDEDTVPIGRVLIRKKTGKPSNRKLSNNNNGNCNNKGEDENSELLPGVNKSRIGQKRFREGDMVWGKVKSHPWWPGQIYNPALATATAKRSRRSGHVLVAFFGDSTFGWFTESDLIPFEPTFTEKAKQTVSRNFGDAVEDAVEEVGRRAALALICYCRNSFNSTARDGYAMVAVPGYETPVIYTHRQIKEARDGFRPAEMLGFVQRMAVSPWCGEDRTIFGIKFAAQVRAYRYATAGPVNEKYREALKLSRRSSQAVTDSDDLHCRQTPVSEDIQRKEPVQFSAKHDHEHVESKYRARNSISEGQYGERENKFLFKRRDRVDEKRSFANRESLTNGIEKSATSQETMLSMEEEETDDLEKYVFQKRKRRKDAKPVFMKEERIKSERSLHKEEHDLEEVHRRKRGIAKQAPQLEKMNSVDNFSPKRRMYETYKTEASVECGLNTNQEIPDGIGFVLRKADKARKESCPNNFVGSNASGNGAARGVPKLLPSKKIKKTIQIGKDSVENGQRGKTKASTESCLSTELEIPDEVGFFSRKTDKANKESPLIDFVRSNDPGVGAAMRSKALLKKKLKKTAHNGKDSLETVRIGNESIHNDSLLKASHVEGEGITDDKSSQEEQQADLAKNMVNIEGHVLCRKSKLEHEEVSGKSNQIEFDRSVRPAGPHAGLTDVNLGTEASGDVHTQILDISATSRMPQLESDLQFDSQHVAMAGLTDTKDKLSLANDAQQGGEASTNVHTKIVEISAASRMPHLEPDLQSDSQLVAINSNDEGDVSLEDKAAFDNVEIPLPVFCMEGQGKGSYRKHPSENDGKYIPERAPVDDDIIEEQTASSVEMDVSRISETHYIDGQDFGRFEIQECSTSMREDAKSICLAAEVGKAGGTSMSTSSTLSSKLEHTVVAGAVSAIDVGIPGTDGSKRLMKSSKSSGVQDPCDDTIHSMQTVPFKNAVSSLHGQQSFEKRIKVSDHLQGIVETSKDAILGIAEVSSALEHYPRAKQIECDGGCSISLQGEIQADMEVCSISLEDQVQGHKVLQRDLDAENSGSILHQLMTDLLSLAIDPFYGIERDCQSSVCQAFLRFRAIMSRRRNVNLSSTLEASNSSLSLIGVEGEEVRKEHGVAECDPLMSLSGDTNVIVGDVFSDVVVQSESSEVAIGSTNIRIFTKLPSDIKSQSHEAGTRVKENQKRKIDAHSGDSLKRFKKSKESKVFIASEKSGLKPRSKKLYGDPGGCLTEPVRQKKKPSRSADSRKSLEEPMALCMKFPRGFALPSEAQLKARFVRFGPLDVSGTRIYCYTGCAQVVFKFTSDAEAAYKYATENSLFGEANVSFRLKQIFQPKKDTVALQSSAESVKKETKMLQTCVESLRKETVAQRSSAELLKDVKLSSNEVPLSLPDISLTELKLNSEDVLSASPNTEIQNMVALGSSDGRNVEEASEDCSIPEVQSLPVVQLKSCLKRPDESGNNNAKEPARVTFQLENMELTPEPQVRRNGFFQIESYSDSVPVSGPLYVKNIATVLERPDVSHRMLYLLKKCNDVIRDVKNSLGFVPYHSV